MTIEEYLQELDETISAAPEVIQIKILRRSVWDTGLEKVLVYRYKLTLIDESLLELTERIVEEYGKLLWTKYRFHWQDRNNQLIKRWDNAPHHAEVDTFPYHLHEGTETHVVPYDILNGMEVVKLVTAEIAKKPA